MDAEVAVAELALDHHEWHALVCELDRMRMTKLMRRESPTDVSGRRRSP